MARKTFKLFLLWLIIGSLGGLSMGVAAAADLGQQAFTVFESKCAECHGPGSAGEGGFDRVLDLKYLIESPEKYIVPFKPEDSEIFYQIDNDFMPYKSSPLSADEKKIVKDWILAGAPLPAGNSVQRISQTALVKLMEKDLSALATTDRKFQRYFSFVHLYNVGTPASRLDTFRQGLTKLLNFLSTNKNIYQPVAVGGSFNSLYRVDIRSLNWNQDKWTALERSYPYFIQQPIYEGLQFATQTQIPVVQADWFSKFASIEPLYGTLLGHPATSAALEKSLGINVAKNEQNFLARRAGFSESGVSLHNRVIERHPIGTYSGYYWLSFDFNSSFGQKDIRENPFGPIGSFDTNKAFQHDGGEIIYQLPNGFHGYLLVNNKTNTLAEAPINIVRDTDPRRPVITNGISCMSCHSQGLRDKNFDIVYDNAEKSGTFSANELKALRSLYATNGEFKQLYEADNKTFRSALKLAGISLVDDNVEQVNQVSYDFDGAIRLDRAAETLGLEPDFLRKELKAKGFGNLLAQLEGTGVARDNFIKVFVQIATKLNLGQPVNSIDLQKALDQAAPGSTLVIPAGLYLGYFNISKSISLKPDGAVEIQGSINIESQDQNKLLNVRLEGFTFVMNRFKKSDFVNSGISARNGVNLELVNMNLTSVFNPDFYGSSTGIQFRPQNARASLNVVNSNLSRFGDIISCFVSDTEKEVGGCSMTVSNSKLFDSTRGFSAWGPATSFVVNESAFSNFVLYAVDAFDGAKGLFKGCTFQAMQSGIISPNQVGVVIQ